MGVIDVHLIWRAVLQTSEKHTHTQTLRERERKMWRDKSPGLKILWLWTFGTAAGDNQSSHNLNSLENHLISITHYYSACCIQCWSPMLCGQEWETWSSSSTPTNNPHHIPPTAPPRMLFEMSLDWLGPLWSAVWCCCVPGVWSISSLSQGLTLFSFLFWWWSHSLETFKCNNSRIEWWFENVVLEFWVRMYCICIDVIELVAFSSRPTIKKRNISLL